MIMQSCVMKSLDGSNGHRAVLDLCPYWSFRLNRLDEIAWFNLPGTEGRLDSTLSCRSLIGWNSFRIESPIEFGLNH